MKSGRGGRSSWYFVIKLSSGADANAGHSSIEPVEAIRATGASPQQVLAWAWGIWPQITPAFAGISVFRWDITIREATMLGLVGAGGIGVNL